MLLLWIQTNAEIKEQVKQNFMKTVYALKVYNQAHPDKQIILPKSPALLNFSQISSRNKASCFLQAAARSFSATWSSVSAKVAKVYYSSYGYIKELANAVKVPGETTKEWLIKQTSCRSISPLRAMLLVPN